LDAHENAVTIARIDERLTELVGNFKSLTKSYQVLNDSHSELEIRYTRMETEWVTAKNLLNWVIGGSALSLVIGLVTLAKLFNII